MFLVLKHHIIESLFLSSINQIDQATEEVNQEEENE